MKILVDTNVMIDYLKRPTDGMKKIFENDEIIITGVLISELLHGALSQNEIKSLEEDLSAYDCLNEEDDDWYKFGAFLNGLRKSGLTLPYPDALIAYIAIKNDVEVWTNDKHFKLIQAADSRLKLYTEK